MRHAVDRIIYCQKGWGCSQAFIMIITEFNSGSLWIEYCVGQLNTSSLVTGAFSRAHWWQGSAKKYPLNWGLLRAGGRGRGLRSVKSRDRDCTILRYPALQNPTGLFDFAQDSLKWMAFFGLITIHCGPPYPTLGCFHIFAVFLEINLVDLFQAWEVIYIVHRCYWSDHWNSFHGNPLRFRSKLSRSAINQIITNKLHVTFKNIGMPCSWHRYFSSSFIFAKCKSFKFSKPMKLHFY